MKHKRPESVLLIQTNWKHSINAKHLPVLNDKTQYLDAFGLGSYFNCGEPCCDNFHKQMSCAIKYISNYTAVTYVLSMSSGNYPHYIWVNVGLLNRFYAPRVQTKVLGCSSEPGRPELPCVSHLTPKFGLGTTKGGPCQGCPGGAGAGGAPAGEAEPVRSPPGWAAPGEPGGDRGDGKRGGKRGTGTGAHRAAPLLVGY